MKTVALLYVAYVVAISLVTFCFYGWDKRQSKLKQWRVPESRLHWLSFLGGWPGSVLGQQFFRHKTQKLGFTISNWSAGLLHAAIVFLFCWNWAGLFERV